MRIGFVRGVGPARTGAVRSGTSIPGSRRRLTFITGAALTAKLGQRAPKRSGLLLGTYTAGAGLGIVVSGVTVQPLLGSLGASGWRWSWVALAALAAAFLLGTVPALRRIEEPDRPSTTAAPATTRTGFVNGSTVRLLALPAAAYLLFGAGYIAYVTFIIAFLRHEGLSDSAVTAVLVAAAVLVLLVHGTVAGLVSATLFGGAFLAVPAGTAHLARRRTPPASWTAAIGGLTVAFAIGQCIGPGLAGVLAERSGGTAVGMLIAAVVLAGAALVNLAGEHPAPR